MRRKSIPLTVFFLGAVLAGMFGVQGAWALWSAHAPANAGTVQAADFRVDLNGTPMIGDDGRSSSASSPG